MFYMSFFFSNIIMCPIRQSAIIHLEPESWPFSEEQLRCKHAFQFIEATGKENITERIRSYESVYSAMTIQ